MSDFQKQFYGGKLLNAVTDYALKNKPELFSLSMSDEKPYWQVFSDEALVNSCFNLFENDFNVSLAAEKMYMHRNTLIYRIKKVERLTGLNVTKFSDAVDFILLYQAYKKFFRGRATSKDIKL